LSHHPCLVVVPDSLAHAPVKASPDLISGTIRGGGRFGDKDMPQRISRAFISAAVKAAENTQPN
jgi:hypothetical protein